MGKMISNEWLEKNVKPQKVLESFLWFSFSKISDDDMVKNLKDFKDHFRGKLFKDEMDWLEKRNEKPEIKQQYKDEVQKEVEKETDLNMKHIQKMVKELNLDKNSWKNMIGIFNGDEV